LYGPIVRPWARLIIARASAWRCVDGNDFKKEPIMDSEIELEFENMSNRLHQIEKALGLISLALTDIERGGGGGGSSLGSLKHHVKEIRNLVSGMDDAKKN
jgi:hypothetical protein